MEWDESHFPLDVYDRKLPDPNRYMYLSIILFVSMVEMVAVPSVNFKRDTESI